MRVGWAFLGLALLAAGCDTREPPRPAFLVASGKELFRDKRFSADGTVACSSCHDVANGGDDGRRVAIGVGERAGKLSRPVKAEQVDNLVAFLESLTGELDAALL
jgi:cytochrome c peroxidase